MTESTRRIHTADVPEALVAMNAILDPSGDGMGRLESAPSTSRSPSGAANVNCAARGRTGGLRVHQAAPTAETIMASASPAARVRGLGHPAAGVTTAGGVSKSSSAAAASAMSRSRRFGSLSRQRATSRRTAMGVAAGSADQSGSRSRIFASVSVTVSPGNARRPASIS